MVENVMGKHVKHNNTQWILFGENFYYFLFGEASDKMRKLDKLKVCTWKKKEK